MRRDAAWSLKYSLIALEHGEDAALQAARDDFAAESQQQPMRLKGTPSPIIASGQRRIQGSREIVMERMAAAGPGEVKKMAFHFSSGLFLGDATVILRHVKNHLVLTIETAQTFRGAWLVQLASESTTSTHTIRREPIALTDVELGFDIHELRELNISPLAP